MNEARERIRLGTYSVELAAGDWQNILVALAAAQDEFNRLGLTETALAFGRTIDWLRPQVLSPHKEIPSSDAGSRC